MSRIKDKERILSVKSKIQELHKQYNDQKIVCNSENSKQSDFEELSKIKTEWTKYSDEYVKLTNNYTKNGTENTL